MTHRMAGWLMLMAAAVAACNGGGDDVSAEVETTAGLVVPSTSGVRVVEVEAKEGYVVLGASSDGVVKVEAPLGSSAVGVEVTVEKVEDGRAAADPLYDGLGGEIVEYDLGPDGQEFDEPVLISFSSSATELGLGENQVPFPFLGVSHAGGVFEPLEATVQRSGDQITVLAELDHFSRARFMKGLYVELAPGLGGSLSLPVGDTLTVTGTVLGGDIGSVSSDRKFELSLVDAVSGSVIASQERLFNRNMTVVFKCESVGAQRINVKAKESKDNHIYTLTSYFVTCEEPVEETVVEPAGEDAPEEIAIDLDNFGIDDLVVLGDGTVAVLSAPFDGKIAYIEEEVVDSKKVVVVEEIALTAPADSHDCETDQSSPDYDFGCDQFGWSLGHSAANKCYYASYPDGTVACIDNDDKPVPGLTIAGEDLCPEKEFVEVLEDGTEITLVQSGRTEKAPSASLNCFPSQPIPTEDGKPSFITLFNGTLMKVQGEDTEVCVTLVDKNFERNFPEMDPVLSFDPDDVTYDAGTMELTIRTTAKRGIALETKVSWPGCVNLTERDLKERDDPPDPLLHAIPVLDDDGQEMTPFEAIWGKPRPDGRNMFWFEFAGTPFGLTVENEAGKATLQFPGQTSLEFMFDKIQPLAYTPEVAFDQGHAFVFLPNSLGVDSEGYSMPDGTAGVLLWFNRDTKEQGQIQISGEITNMVISNGWLYASVNLQNNRGEKVTKLLRYDLNVLSGYK